VASPRLAAVCVALALGVSSAFSTGERTVAPSGTADAVPRVVVRHRDGRNATYAHMQKGSLTVAVGDRVRAGQTLGRLGNTGNTSAPHLHFQITEGSESVLGSSGVPFALDRFSLQGQVDPQRWATATTLEGTWNEGLLSTPSPRRAQSPLDLNIVDFGDKG
jgi:murein DD-endopeptidase MepM/ murein hydrolase activator NlpD